MHDKVLLLNKNWQPIASTLWNKAVCIVMRGHGSVVDHKTYEKHTWESWMLTHAAAIDADVDPTKFIRTSTCWIECPRVITLARFGGMPKRRLAYSRNGLYARDSHRGTPQCQYCACAPKGKTITVDHVVPRAQGGRTSWENCVVACVTCNTVKRNRTPLEAGMRLLKKPLRPTEFKALIGEILPEWENFITTK